MVNKVLVVGGGVGGMTAALELRRHGVEVDLIDADPHWRVYGAGISLTGLSLRAFDHLGILDEVRRRGHVHAGLRGKGLNGETLFEPPAPENPKPVESGGGILRPVLHEILATRVRASGAKVSLGVKIESLSQDADGVDVVFSDGRRGRFDLVVGADGIYSSVRQMIFPDAPKPKFTGQGCWRVVAAKPADMDRSELYFGGLKLGLVPVSREQMYMFLLEHVPDNPFYAEEDRIPHLAELMRPFGGAVAEVRQGLGPDSLINYRPLEWLLLPDPWFDGRVALIGDAAHATTPHMAAGAGIAVEDGIVLADELSRHSNICEALEAFMSRRFKRAKTVVENSVRIGEMEIAGGGSQIGNGNAVLAATMQELRAPY